MPRGNPAGPCNWDEELQPSPMPGESSAVPTDVGGGEKLVHFGGKEWTGRVATLCSGQLRNPRHLRDSASAEECGEKIEACN